MAADKLLIVQRVSIALGTILVAVWAAAWLHKTLGRQNDLAAFEEAREAIAQSQDTAAEFDDLQENKESEEDDQGIVVASAVVEEPEPVPVPLPTTGEPDTSQWAPGRIEEYEHSLQVDKRVPQALLRIPDIDLTVPLLDGIDEVTLNRGVGRIPGMARRIEDGRNFGIAGHRDGYFRGLKDVGEGDLIEILTLTDTFKYRIDNISIIEKDDLSVLQPTEDHVITLVTCYPFYFVGHAPQRYIVRAVLDERQPRS